MGTIQRSGDAASSTADRTVRWLYQPLLPLFMLLVIELALALSLAMVAPVPVSALRLLTVGGMLVIGLTPVLLRPGWLIGQVGSLQVLLAALLCHTGGVRAPEPFSLSAFANLLPDLRVALGLIHAALAVPLILQIVARFPRRSSIPDWLLGAGYGLFGMLAVGAVLAPAAWRASMIVALVVGAAVASVLVGWLLFEAIRDPRPEQRQQLAQARLLFAGLVLALLPVMALPALRMLGGSLPTALQIALLVCFPAAGFAALLRQDLLRIDVALQRALGYALTSGGLLALYFGLTLTLTALLPNLIPASSQLITVLAVLGAASAFPWLQRQANRLITRAFYPERLSFQQELTAAQEQLGRVVRHNEVVALLTEALPERLGVAWAHLQLLPDPPPAVRDAWSAPLLVGGRQLGIYWLGPRRTGLPFAPDEQERLRGLAQQAALALAYAENYQTLAALNAELEDRVAARTAQLLAHQRELATLAERQRLARDLHDSLKQNLFSLGLSLHALTGLVQRDPARARGLLAQEAERVVQAQGELAELLSDLRATPNTSADLVVALRHEAARFATQHQFPIALELPSTLILAEPVARELVAIAREALHNSFKHSGAPEASVRLRADDGEIVLVVCDPGRGFDPAQAQQHGHGLRGMHERVATLGGTLTMSAPEGKGTQLWVRIPQHRPSAF
ncbi:MAG: sensor histidine kinase [Oscillochloridaceae bacterium umkhey_bin13]